MTKQLQGHQMVAVIHDDFFQHFVLCDAVGNGQKCIHNFEADEDYGWDEYTGSKQCPFNNHVKGMSDFAAYRYFDEDEESDKEYTIFDTKVTTDSSGSNLKVREDPNGQEIFSLVTRNEYAELQVDGDRVDKIDFPISIMSVIPITWYEDPEYMPTWDFTGEKKVYRPTDSQWDKIMKRRFNG